MIYVDEPQRPNKGWCHMFGTDEDALHLFAYRLGLRRSWFQDKPGFPHYDLSPAKRRAAVAMGAKPITNYEMAKIVQEWQAERDYFEKVYIFIREIRCPTCDGQGIIDWDPDEGTGTPCPQCVGAKTVEVEDEMTQSQWDADF